jgi:hypothetical protein
MHRSDHREYFGWRRGSGPPARIAPAARTRSSALEDLAEDPSGASENAASSASSGMPPKQDVVQRVAAMHRRRVVVHHGEESTVKTIA